MNKHEFNNVFSVFCGAYNKKPENEEFTAKAHWWKVKDLSEKEYMDVICRAIDTHKIMPTVGTLMEIKKIIPKQEKPTQQRNPKYMYNPDGSRLTMRQHFEIANKNIIEKKKRGIEHINLVKLYDDLKAKAGRRTNEGNVKKVSDCL